MPARIKKNHHSKKSRSAPGKNRKEVQEKGSFRVIAGELRSRRFEFPVIDGLRPTTDRVKETVFNWLQAYVEGSRVLDLFTGSGSMSFEAISRGAEFVLMLEKSSLAARSLERNCDLANISSSTAEVLCIDTFKALSDAGLNSKRSGFDIVLIDPPFRKGMLQEVVDSLNASQMLSARAYVYIEREKEGSAIVVPQHWRLVKNKQAGQVAYELYEVSAT